jgi:putative ATP-binding cassette transporter
VRAKVPLLSPLIAVALPVFRSELRRRALGVMILLAGLLLLICGLNVASNYVTRDFMTALASREERRFYMQAGALVLVFGGATTASAFARYIEERLGLRWRDWLTRQFLHRYLHDRAYVRLVGREDVDNPDQRMSDDVKTFTTLTLSILILVFNALLTIVSFSSVLCSITPWLFVASVGYAVAGSLGIVVIGRTLVGFDNAQFRKEADFRYALVRVREHAGAVAQMGSERDEKQRLGAKLVQLVANYRKIVDVNRNLAFFVNAYNYLTQLIPVAIVAPLYVRGKVEFGIVAQSTMAFAFTVNGFSLIVSQFQQLSSYAAVVRRLGALWEATTETERPVAAEAHALQRLVSEAEPGGRRVAYEGVTLETSKEGRVLLQDLSLDLPEGRRLVITGHNGAGKTALVTATAGLWKAGRGRIVRPAAPDVMFLPQQPYAIAGKLLDHLLYSLDRDRVEREGIADVLRLVGLSDVVARVGGLGAENDWPNTLSESELQRFAVARLLLAKPRFAFLDQALAALDAVEEEKLYASLSSTDITYVSVGDSPALIKFHDMRLELHGDGAWTSTAT